MRLGYPTGQIVREGKSNGAQLSFHSDTTWALSAGVGAVVYPFYMDPEEAEFLNGIGDDVQLEITYPNNDGNDVEIVAKKLSVIGLVPTSNDYTGGVLVADQRFWWGRNHIKRRYNIRTRSGDVRRLDADGEIFDQIAQRVWDVDYKKYSLKDGRTPWKAYEIAGDILDAVIGEGEWAGDLEKYSEWASNNPPDVEIDDNGANAVSRALNYLPGASIYVSLDGTPTVYNILDVDAAKEVLDGMVGFFNEGEPVLVDLKHQRPESIDVLLSVEQEVRFDVHRNLRSLQGKGSGTTSGPSDSWKDIRYCENVIPIPDPSLKMPGHDKPLVQGTWVAIDDILDAWNADKGNSRAPDLTHAFIRKFWVVGILEMVWGTFGKSTPDVVWLNRIRALRAHYQQTYRINPWWIQKVYSFRPYRVALLDPETGSFAASYVYTDYTVQFSYRGGFIEGVHQNAMQTVLGGVEPEQAFADAEHPSEAVLSVLDHELGIVRYDLRRDLLEQVRNMIPGAIKDVGTLDPRQWKKRDFYTDGVRTTGRTYGITLEDRHRVSFVVTMAPGMPNDDRQLFRMNVIPTDADSYVPGRNIGTSTGPVWEIRIGPQLATARFAWANSKKKEIEESMGVRPSKDKSGDRQSLVAAKLLQNPVELKDLSEAVAAGLWSSLLDRWEGRKTTVIDPDVIIAGHISRVEWLIQPGGARTTVVVPTPTKKFDLLGAMPVSARKVILKEVQPRD